MLLDNTKENSLGGSGKSLKKKNNPKKPPNKQKKPTKKPQNPNHHNNKQPRKQNKKNNQPTKTHITACYLSISYLICILAIKITYSLFFKKVFQAFSVCLFLIALFPSGI